MQEKADLDSDSSEAGDRTRSPSPLVINETDKRKISEKPQREEILETLHRIDATMKAIEGRMLRVAIQQEIGRSLCRLRHTEVRKKRAQSPKASGLYLK